jgi:hypothetical protein
MKATNLTSTQALFDDCLMVEFIINTNTYWVANINIERTFSSFTPRITARVVHSPNFAQELYGRD